MVELHPSILEHDGKKAFVVLPYDEFEKLKEELEDFEDLKDLRRARSEEEDAPTMPLSNIRDELNS